MYPLPMSSYHSELSKVIILKHTFGLDFYSISRSSIAHHDPQVKIKVSVAITVLLPGNFHPHPHHYPKISKHQT